MGNNPTFHLCNPLGQSRSNAGILAIAAGAKYCFWGVFPTNVECGSTAASLDGHVPASIPGLQLDVRLKAGGLPVLEGHFSLTGFHAAFHNGKSEADAAGLTRYAIGAGLIEGSDNLPAVSQPSKKL